MENTPLLQHILMISPTTPLTSPSLSPLSPTLHLNLNKLTTLNHTVACLTISIRIPHPLHRDTDNNPLQDRHLHQLTALHKAYLRHRTHNTGTTLIWLPLLMNLALTEVSQNQRAHTTMITMREQYLFMLPPSRTINQ